MRSKSILVGVAIVVFCISLPKAEAIVYFDAGGEWDIDFCIYDRVIIGDHHTEGPTTVNLLDGGYIKDGVNVYDYSEFNMFGGEVGWDGLTTWDDSTAYICGGALSTGSPWSPFALNLKVYQYSTVTIEGTDFNYPYGTFSNTVGLLTGTLLNGDEILVPFDVTYPATMTLVPEPATILLLGLGAVMLRRRRGAK